MDTLVLLLTPVVPMAYLLAVVAYVLDFVTFHPVAAGTARRLLNGALGLHAVQLGLRGWLYEHVPLASRAEVLGTVAFAIAGVYLLVERRTRVERTGPFVVGIACVLATLGAAFLSPVTQIPAILRSPLFAAHAGTAVLSYAAFGLSAVYGVLSLVLHRALKRGQFGGVFDRLPSLDTLSRMSLTAAAVGVGFLTVAIALGLAWASREFSEALFDPKIVMTVVVWFAYGFVIVAHRRLRWSRRRTIGLSLVAFGLLVAAVLATALGLPSFHRFA